MSLRDTLDVLLRDAHLAGSARDGAVVVVLSRESLMSCVDDAWTLLDPAERERVQRKRREDDRLTTLLAYACHRLVLAAVLGREPAAVPLFRDEQGCPRLRDGSVQTSLSHADPFIAIAVSASGPVGVDVERRDRAIELPGIAERVGHPTELAAIDRLPPAERAPALLALWVRKEALLKAAGVGLLHDMDGFEAPPGEPLALPGVAAGPTMTITMLDGIDFGTGAIASVAGSPLVQFVAA